MKSGIKFKRANFKEIVPERVNRKRDRQFDEIWITFGICGLYNQYAQLRMYIGKNVCAAMNMKENDRVLFYVDIENPRIWMMKKSQTKDGYKINEHNKTRPGPSYKIMLPWKEFKPTPMDNARKLVKYEIDNDEIVINAE